MFLYFGLLAKAMVLLLIAATLADLSFAQVRQAVSRDVELSRPVRPWEFLSATGRRSALLGNESGRVEAWVYPVKIFRNFHLQFLTENRVLPAESLARTITVHPESATILYVGDTFAVRETFFAPVDEPGAVIFFDVETEQPLEIEADFHRDFQLEWPAGLGGTFSYWNPVQHAFYMSEEQRKFAALVGSPTGTMDRAEYQTNYSESGEDSFRLGATQKGGARKLIVIAGSVNGAAEAEATYRHLSNDADALLHQSAAYYQDYLNRTSRVDLPDAQLQQAYDWALVSTVQGIVSNPLLGTGLVAGYRTSGESQRPGFAWYFGRDSFWTSFALNAAGDYASSRTALEFISGFQRDDGKIPHEIAQGANFVPWFKDYPYAYASADATPLYIIAANDYVVKSGDLAFAKEKWSSLRKAYEFLQSTYDEQGFPKNFGIGHGWVEGGPLLPVETELYQTAVGIEAVRSLSNLAALTGNENLKAEAAKDFERLRQRMNEAFWMAEKNRFAFAMDRSNHPVDEPSVLATVPMWFGLLDANKADGMLPQLADFDHETDWGMRIISAASPKFSGGGYHYGSVWPLFTGWAAVGGYRYHHDPFAYSNLRANALLAFDGSLGHVAEVLSGDYYQPLSTSSPHQIWSAAMVVSPILKGMLGLETDAIRRGVTLAPHLPADWATFSVKNVKVGGDTLSLRYSRDSSSISLEALRASGAEECTLDFLPAVSLHAKVQRVDLNGKPIPFRIDANGEDQHIVVRVPIIEGKNFVRVALSGDFGVSVVSGLPALGSESRGLRIISEAWSPGNDQLVLDVAGAAGSEYSLAVWNPAEIRSVDGASVRRIAEGATLVVKIPASASQKYAHVKVTIHFQTKTRGK